MAVALSEADVAGMLEVLHEAAVVDGPDAFTEPVVDALVRLLPVDGGACCNVFAGRDPRVPGEQLTVVDFAAVGAEWIRKGSRLWRIPRIPAERLTVVDFASIGAEWIRQGPTLWREEFTQALRLYGAEEEPVPPKPELMLVAVREADMLSYRERRKSHLWWEVDRHFGNDSLALWLPAPEEGLMRRLNFTSLERAIPDRYVRILQLLAPHFVTLYRRAAARRARGAHSMVSPRELEILSLVGAGKTNKEIARELWLSPHTVRSHLENAFEKLEVTTRTAAVARAFGYPAAARPPG
jgi:DNA-binding CsgD family transcriptional regulator